LGVATLRLQRVHGKPALAQREPDFQATDWRMGGSFGESVSNGIAKRELVLDSEFLDLPETSLENGVTGFFLNPLTGAFKQHLPPDWLRQNLRRSDPATSNSFATGLAPIPPSMVGRRRLGSGISSRRGLFHGQRHDPELHDPFCPTMSPITVI
jgi:hypothetical protein